MNNRLSIQPFTQLAGFFMLTVFAVVLFDLEAWVVLLACILPFLLFAPHQPRIIFYFLLITIPPSIEYSVGDSLATDLPDEPWIVLCCFLGIAGLVAQRSKWRVMFQPLAGLLLVQLAWQVISVITSTDLLVSVKFLAAKTWYLGAFVLLPLLYLQEKNQIRNAALFFTGSVLLCMVWVVFRHATTGFTFSTINESVKPFFRNHVNYSVLVVCILPVLFAVTTILKDKTYQVVAWLLLFLVLAALYFTYSRGAWLALLTGIIAFWLLKKRLLLFGYVAAIVLCMAAVFYLAHNDRYEQYAPDYNSTIFHTDFREHWVATYQLKDLSTAERFHRWIAGIRMVKDRWLTGWGPATFYPAYKEYTAPSFKTWVSDNPERSTVHNYFLLTLVEQGVAGLSILILLLGFAFYTVQKIYHRTRDPFWRLCVTVSGIILVKLCTVNFLSDLVETDEGGSLFYICLAVIIICDIKTKKDLKFTSYI